MSLDQPSILGLAAAVLTTIFVVELLRRGILREKFAVLWLVVSAAVIVMAAFPRLVAWLSDLAGVQVPANLLFFLTIVLLLLVSVQLSYEVSRLEVRTRRLAEEIALLQEDVRQLKADSEASGSASDGGHRAWRRTTRRSAGDQHG